jgi:serine/threonine-protein kinase
MSGPLLALIALLVFVLAGALTASLFDRDPGTDPTTSPSATGASSASEPATQTSSTSTTTTQSPTTAPTTTTPTTTTTTPAPTGIEVLAANYVGRKLKDVQKELERLGLVVNAVPAEVSDAPENQVTAVEEGTYAEGETVRVEYSEGNSPGNDEGGDDQ